MQLGESMTRKKTASGDFDSVSSDVSDETKLSGPMAALSASYQFFEKTPLTFRVPNAFSDGSPARLGLLCLGSDDTSGTFVAVVPSIAARDDF